MPPPAPSVTAVLLLYDCERFAAEAVDSVLAQEHQPLDVVISDDASTDGTLEVARQRLADYRGPHRVSLRRRDANTGSKTGHLNALLPEVEGEILVFFDGDDVSTADRTTRIVQAFVDEPQLHAVYSDMSLIDEESRPLGAAKVPRPPASADVAAWFARVDAYGAGGGLAIRRTVVERFGPIDPRLHEDVVLTFRASLLGGVRFLDRPLVRARRHAGSLTADLRRYDSLESYRDRMLAGIEKAALKERSRLADLEAAVALMPERKTELLALAPVVTASRAEAELTAGLASPSLATRLATLLRLTRTGAYRDELGRHASIALFPRLYLRYKRRSLGRRIGARRL